MKRYFVLAMVFGVIFLFGIQEAHAARKGKRRAILRLDLKKCKKKYSKKSSKARKKCKAKAVARFKKGRVARKRGGSSRSCARHKSRILRKACKIALKNKKRRRARR